MVARGELQHMRAVRGFAHFEGGFGFGVKAPSTCGDQRRVCELGLLACVDPGDAVEAQAWKFWQQGDGFFVGGVEALCHVGLVLTLLRLTWCLLCFLNRLFAYRAFGIGLFAFSEPSRKLFWRF